MACQASCACSPPRRGAWSRWTWATVTALWAAALSGAGVAQAHLTYIEAREPLKGTPPPPGSPWPMPQIYMPNPRLLELRPERFRFYTTNTNCDIVVKALERYRKVIFLLNSTARSTGLPLLSHLTVELPLDAECGFPQHGMDEHYSLLVDVNSTAVISAETAWGALRGLETFSQLVYIDEITNNYLINRTGVIDWPRFPFRGILLDTARHFLPVNVLKQNLEAMAFNKFNVFHWHIVDDQSWPLEMVTFPNLTRAAYHPRLIYSRQDVQEIIEFARERGIRIIPEIDTPGHTQAVGKIFPDILTACYGPGGRGTPRYPDFAAYEILNPIQNYTYDVMLEIFKEVKQTFPDQYIHLGMDEVYYKCWESSPEIAAFMKLHNMTRVSAVEQYYAKKTLDNVRSIGARYMIWQDPIDNGVTVAPDTVVGVWRSTYANSWQSYLSRAVRHGYQIVLSTPWYLNYISYGQDWTKYYEVEPTNFTATKAEKELIIGGEACMWGEYVDASNVISRLWPRASAVAERLWSSEIITDPEEAKWRLDEHRCRMLRRGIPTAPILNGYCGGFELDK